MSTDQAQIFRAPVSGTLLSLLTGLIPIAISISIGTQIGWLDAMGVLALIYVTSRIVLHWRYRVVLEQYRTIFSNEYEGELTDETKKEIDDEVKLVIESNIKNSTGISSFQRP